MIFLLEIVGECCILLGLACAMTIVHVTAAVRKQVAQGISHGCVLSSCHGNAGLANSKGCESARLFSLQRQQQEAAAVSKL